MKNRITFFLLLMLLTMGISAQNQTVLVSSSENETVLTLKLDKYNLSKVSTSKGEAFVINAENGFSLLKAGEPDMAKFASSIIIPNEDEMKVEILSSTFTDLYQEMLVAPSKGNLTRDIDPSKIAYTFGEVYQKNEFYPGKIADLNSPFIIRDYRGQTVNFYPIQYNPITKKVRIYSEITVKISSTGKKGQNVFTNTKTSNVIDSEFNNIYSNFFLNYASKSKYTALAEEGKMLIICTDAYMAEMTDFVKWKNQRGMQTEMVSKTTAGATAAAIKTYVQNYYTANGLTFLLLIGDAGQIPTNSGGSLGGDSDNAYAYVTGNDHYQEFFVGRFSAESTADVATQVRRTLEYEKSISLADGWLNKPLAIGSDQGPGDDNELDYQHQRNMMTDLTAFGYQAAFELFDGSQSGLDEPGNPSATNVSTALNTGAGIVTYTGHGSDTSFGTTGFSNSNMSSLTNVSKLPFIWSVACVNGNFVGQTCFAEAWMRSKNAAGAPTGAVATFMSTINQSWNPPMIGQDEMVDILVSSDVNKVKRTFGGISVNGCFKMNEESSDFAMTDTWTIFGDPSLTVRTANSTAMTVTHLPTVLVGSSTFAVNCNQENAIACLSLNGVIIGTAKVIGGVANVPTPGITPGTTLDLVVTGFNRIPYISQLQVITPSGPYIVFMSKTINDSNGNNNGAAEFGETFNIDITLKNVGVAPSSGNVTAVIASESNYVQSIANNTFNYSVIGAGAELNSTGSFTVTLTNDVPDQTLIPFTVEINDGGVKTTWSGTFSFVANAPVLDVTFDAVNDAVSAPLFNSTPIVSIDKNVPYAYSIEVIETSGNNDGRLDAGETAGIIVNALNIGHANLNNVTCTLSSTSNYVTINTNTVQINSLEVGGIIPAEFGITVDPATPIGTIVPLTFTLSGGSYTQTVTFNQPVGLVIEDFESGNLTAINWVLTGTPNWAAANTGAFEGTYCAKSGAISAEGSTSMSLTLNGVTAGQTLKFHYKVSSEATYDFLKFYVGATEVQTWSGDVAWTEYTHTFATAGNYVIKFEYMKDGSMNSGSDCAWLDNFILPVAPSKAKETKSTITIDAVTIPSWLTLTNTGNGTATLTGTTPNENGVHSVSLTATSGTVVVEQNFDISVGITGISQIESNISIYPNPTSGGLNIVISDNTNSEIEISDISGRIVLQKQLINKTNSIDLSRYTKGIYIVKVKQNNNVKTSKVTLK